MEQRAWSKEKGEGRKEKGERSRDKFCRFWSGQLQRSGRFIANRNPRSGKLLIY